MDVLRRLWFLVPSQGSVAHGVRGALTVMAFTDSGWMRRFRVPKAAVAIFAGLLVALTVTTVVSVSFAVWAGADLRRLGSIERENRSLTTQLQDQAAQLGRLQSEMSRLRELEKSLRSVSGLPESARGTESTGQGGGLAVEPRK